MQPQKCNCVAKTLIAFLMAGRFAKSEVDMKEKVISESDLTSNLNTVRNCPSLWMTDSFEYGGHRQPFWMTYQGVAWHGHSSNICCICVIGFLSPCTLCPVNLILFHCFGWSVDTLILWCVHSPLLPGRNISVTEVVWEISTGAGHCQDFPHWNGGAGEKGASIK